MSLNLTDEFVSSFETYVRVSGGSQTIDDDRKSVSRQMAEIPVDEFVAMMAEVPHDVAAIFSGVVKVVATPKDMALLSHTNGDGLRINLGARADLDALPLSVVPDHPAAELFRGMLETIPGCELYLNVAMLLYWAQSQPGIRPYLCR